MDDSAIRNYCTWARNELRDEVMRRCAIYGVSEKPSAPADADAVGGRVLTDVEKRQRAELLRTVKADGLDRTVERAAYTWFNRIAAIRFMEVNDRLPSRTRLLSANDGSFRPQALQEPLSVDIEGLDRAEVARLVQAGDDEATFRCLLLAQCHELAECMPGVFERVGAAMELLLPDGLLREGGVIERMVDGIPEPDWAEGVEIVGWMYQYYNQERKDEYFASKRKATADDIAPATQLFTPEWIVRYLVENSLGRLWMLNFPDSRLKDSMEYYIDPGDEHEEDFLKIGSPEDITFCDPCCGSGHILVYAFDLLARMYEEQGFSRREIPQLVLTKNLTGIEIDRRAGQLASFALTMKACEYDRRFLSRGVRPSVTVLEPVKFEEGELAGTALLLNGHDLLDAFTHLDEVGSLYVPAKGDLALVESAIETKRDADDMFSAHAISELETMLSELNLLSKSFSVAATNPPYLNSPQMSKWLSMWTKKRYDKSKRDLCTCFIERSLDFLQTSGIASLVTMQSWMFLGSYAKFRKSLLDDFSIVSMAHIGVNVFEGLNSKVTSVTAAVFLASRKNNAGTFVRLTDIEGGDNKSKLLREVAREENSSSVYLQVADTFRLLPRNIIAYWICENAIIDFSNCIKLGSVYKARLGLQSGDNDRFIHEWFEVSRSSICTTATDEESSALSRKKWFPHNKGGEYRKWYGNRDLIVNYENYGSAIKTLGETGKTVGFNGRDIYFKEGITWSALTNIQNSFRFVPSGSIYDSNKGPAIITDSRREAFELLALLNSSTGQYFLHILNPTISLQNSDIDEFPLLPSLTINEDITNSAQSNVLLARDDWDARETSLEFKRNPLLIGDSILDAYKNWESICSNRIENTKQNEERINAFFSSAYHLDGRVPVTVPIEKISLHVADRRSDVVSLINYAVGCMMGRYSLDVDGLVLADQGATLQNYLEKVPNPTFMPDEDGIIPLTDVEYFHDDATGLFVDFLKAAYGEEKLEENLAFVAESLGVEGAPREAIRDYFRNNFFYDHCNIYNVSTIGKCPIYWLFDSGKKGGFRALFYMHRYTPDLLARLRTDYVHPQQERYRNQIEHIDEVLPTADRREAARLKKERKRLSDQLAETNAYEEKVHHLADQMIKIDLDDGVKHNYALFQDVLAKIK
jgi:hypothetical protein